ERDWKRSEAMSLYGAICKTAWECDGRREHLYRALEYYRLAFRDATGGERVATAQGYPAINAAFLLDLLAADFSRKEVDEATRDAARRQRAEAERLRGAVLAELPELERKQPEFRKQWWFQATRVEALLGLGRHEEACAALQAAISDPDRELAP